MSATLSRSRIRRVPGWWRTLDRRMHNSDAVALSGLVLLTIALTAAGVMWHGVFSYVTLLVPIFLGSLWLTPRRLPWFVVFALIGVCVLLATQPNISVRSLVQLITTFLISFLVVVSSFRRARLGVTGPRSESMFVDLQDRITKQGQMPPLPSEWYVESVTRSAGGTSFAGDFVVSSRAPDRKSIEIVVVDVSGKGVDAGTRALLLSGAFGGICSSMPPGEFLPAANGYLLRQDWDEGFATAVHLHLELETGEFELRKAGHPPPIWLHAGSGRWSVVNSDGPVLGLIDGTEFECVTGVLAPGDALLLFTDGLVESSRRDITTGIDKLAGRGQRLFQTGFDGGGRRLVAEIDEIDDDRALVLVHRRTLLESESHRAGSERMTGIEPA